MQEMKQVSSKAPKKTSKVDNMFSKVLLFVSSKAFLVFCYTWFVIQALFFAITTRFGVPPDETYHFNLIQLFTKNGWLPFIHNQNGYYSLGEVTRSPFFLYHYFLSLPNHLFIHLNSLLLLRVTNICLSLVSIFLVYKIAKYLKFSNFVTNLSIFILVNTLMFSFISGSVSYDNLFIALSMAGVLLTLRLMSNLNVKDSLYFVSIILAGSLVKVNFLVVAATLIIILLVSVYLKYRKLGLLVNKLRKSYVASERFAYIATTIFILLLSGLFVQKYIGNIVKYRSPSPACDRVLTIDQCRESALFRRSETLNNSARPAPTKNILEYSGDWAVLMGKRIYGVFAHEVMLPFSSLLIAIQLIFVVGFLSLVRNISRKDKNIILLLLMSLAYIVILIIKNNGVYNRYGSFDFAVQGRYAFFSLPLLYLVFSFYIYKIKFYRKVFLPIFTMFVILVFFLSSLPSYLLLTGPRWFNGNSNHIRNDVIKDIKTVF